MSVLGIILLSMGATRRLKFRNNFSNHSSIPPKLILYFPSSSFTCSKPSSAMRISTSPAKIIMPAIRNLISRNIFQSSKMAKVPAILPRAVPISIMTRFFQPGYEAMSLPMKMAKSMAVLKKILLTIILLFLLGGVSLAGVFYWQNLRGIGPVINPPQQNIADIISSPKPGTNTTGLPLQLPPGFSVSIFAKDLGSPRVMLPLDYGYMLVSIPAQGKVVALKDDNADGVSDHMYTVLTGLDQPHGLAMYYHGEMTLYIAESDQVSTYDFDFDNQKATNKKKVLDLPGGGGHFTRTLLIIQTPGGDKLLTSIGSSCNVCNEQDDRRAKVLISSLDGSDMRTYASGLRNAVFLTTHPTTKQAWVTEMGRDLLGDNIPPDEINILKEGKDYGW